MSEQKQGGAILERAHLLAADFAGEQERYSLAALHVRADGGVEATNGHYAIQVPPSKMPAEDYPAVNGMGHSFNGDGLLLPVAACRDALKALPKRSTIPILACAHVGANGQEGHAVLTTTDLETASTRDVTLTAGRFPDIDHVMPDDEAATLRIGMNPEYLKRIADFALKVGAREIVLSVKDPSMVMRWDIPMREGGTSKVALMPMKVD